MDRTIQNADDTDLELEEFENFALSPTGVHRTFHVAFDCFNQSLFDATLPEVLITMQRRGRAYGYFSADRFAHRRGSEVVDEIALNPSTMQDRSDREIASTLVHEMVHLWQQHFGKPGRRRYHNQQWAAKMDEVGLTPSHSGKPGGKRTGQSVSHYIVDGGAFDREWQLLAESNFTFDYQDRLTNGPGSVRKIKVRYACPICSIHVWGKSELRIMCLDCNEPMRMIWTGPIFDCETPLHGETQIEPRCHGGRASVRPSDCGGLSGRLCALAGRF